MAQNDTPCLIGYTELRTDVPGGRAANVMTERACVVRADGTGRRELAPKLVANANTWTQFAGWSPDGKQAIVACGWESSENATWEEEHKTFRMVPGAWLLDCYLVDIETGQPFNFAPQWSPDGEWVAFVAGEAVELMRVSLAGKVEQLSHSQPDVLHYHPRVSPDGKRMAFGATRDGVRQLWVANADGSEARPITALTKGHAAMWAHWQPVVAETRPKPVPEMPAVWRVFGPLCADPKDLPETRVDMARIADLPDVLTVGGKAFQPHTVRPDDGHIDFGEIFGGFETYDTAYAFAEIRCDRPTELTIGAGADWWMQWWVNGERVGDTTATGNSGWPLQITDHVFRAPLRQGRNLIGVRVISGSNSFTLKIGGGAEVRRERDAQRRWPEAPVPVSAVEGLIEGFWSPALDAVSRWRSTAGELTASWDACFFTFPVTPERRHAEMMRAYQLPLDGWQRLRVRLRPGAGVRTVVSAEMDGAERVVAEHTATDHGEVEITGPVEGKELTRLTLRFAVADDAETAALESAAASSVNTHSILLRWVMLEKDGKAWTPPERPFDGMIADGAATAFEPGLGLIFGEPELERMRQAATDPMFESLWQEDLAQAARQFRTDPASVIRPYVLYGPTRYGRIPHLDIDTGMDGLTLALIGLISGDDAYMRQAARYAVALAMIDEWSEGFVDRLPEAKWTHAGFAPNVATIKASLLLDWTWNWLTPEGREFVREAIRRKGLHWLRGMQNCMANQGIRFTKGLVLGHIAVADNVKDPALQAKVRAFLAKLNRKVDDAARPDGTFSEGMDYGRGTMASLPITYVAAGRCLDQPVAELVSERFLPAMRFILTAERRIAPSFAAFCAGPLGDDLFADQCVPTSVMAAYGGAEWNATGGNTCEYVFYGLIPVWAPKMQSVAEPPRLPPFSVFPEGDWVFMGSDAPEAPRVSFESGLWDGHGHSWYHKHAITLDGWGERLLITRHHLAYDDARSRYTMSTKLYNTFAPGGRDQDATGTPGRGARLIKAEDQGAVVLVESDNATAWKHNVARAVRRALFIRPNVVVVQDVVELEDPETGVQSWNSLHPWTVEGNASATSRAGEAGVRVTCVGTPAAELTAGEASVHHTRSPDGEVPVYRAAFTSPAARQHRLLTVIAAIPPEGAGEPASVKVLDEAQPLIEIRQGNSLVRVAGGEVDPARMWGHKTNDEFSFAVRERTE